MPRLSREMKWRAEDDARTLAEANVIKNDKKRLAAAQQVANKMAEDAAVRAATLKQVVKMKRK
jgi:hypothetical protein